MRRLRYYIRLWNGYQRISLLMVTQYPADTVIWILSMLLMEASAFLGVVTIANVAGGFGRWNLYELCLLFSMCAIIEAIGQSFFDNIWGINYHVKDGLLDVYMIRPASVFIQLLGERFHYQAIISMTAYIGLMIYSMVHLGIGLGIGTLFFLLEFLICGTAVNSGIYLIFNSLNFWLIQGNDLPVLVQTCREFAKYPLSVFPSMIGCFFTFIIPFGFVGYYPAAYLTGKSGNWVLFAMPVCALTIGLIGSVIWRTGIRGYESTGN